MQLLKHQIKEKELQKKLEDKAEDIGDKLRALGGQNNNYNDNKNENIRIRKIKKILMIKVVPSSKNNNNDKVSIADELRELAKLKQEGILTEEEFTEMKEDLIE